MQPPTFPPTSAAPRPTAPRPPLPTQPEPPEAPQPRRRRTLGWLALVLGAVLVGLVGGRAIAGDGFGPAATPSSGTTDRVTSSTDGQAPAPADTAPDATGTGSAPTPAPTTDPTAPATGLDPELRRRFDEAVAAAAADGVELTLTSGWRSAEDQQELLDKAVARYGSVEEASRWVLPPDKSAHVAGTAIDVGPTDGAYWLERYGARFGLCRAFANEIWHYEATTEPGGTCPEMLPDGSSLWDG